MSTNHTPEPWRCVVYNDALTKGPRVRIEIINSDDDVVAVSEIKRYGIISGMRIQKISDMESECNHIVKCVNACAGINPEAVPDVVAALRQSVNWFEGNQSTQSGSTMQVITAARAALAKLEDNQCTD